MTRPDAWPVPGSTGQSGLVFRTMANTPPNMLLLGLKYQNLIKTMLA